MADEIDRANQRAEEDLERAIRAARGDIRPGAPGGRVCAVRRLLRARGEDPRGPGLRPVPGRARAGLMITRKQRRRLRSLYWPDMHPHIFDKLLVLLPHVLAGIDV